MWLKLSLMRLRRGVFLSGELLSRRLQADSCSCISRFAVLLLLFGAGRVHGFVALDGYVIATSECPAYQSIRKKTNPGEVAVVTDRAYRLTGINRDDGEYFSIEISDAPVTRQRWVSVTCGLHVVPAGESQITDEPVDRIPAGSESTDNVIALSWQPAFCEKKPNKKECIALNSGLLPSSETRLSIHGLWAQPRERSYCGVSESLRRLDQSGNWHRLPPLDLSVSTREQLVDLMPGAASHLHRHEWIKHGTCHFGRGGAEEYYSDTLLLTRMINESGLADYLHSHLGETIETSDIRQLFNQWFGAGAGNRVQFHCSGDGKRVLLQELRISITGIVEPQADLAALLGASPEVSLGCPSGTIDPVGLQ